MNLSARRFLNVYQHHLAAICLLVHGEFQLAGAGECIAIDGLRALLRDHNDHYVFADMYMILSACLLEVSSVESAIEVRQKALAILLKHTPTNYKSISLQYFFLALAYRVGQECRATELCLMKAIETARLSDELHQRYIPMLEEILQSIQQPRNDDIQLRMTIRQLHPNPGESHEDFLRRTTAEMIAFNAKNGTLQIDKAEFERLPDKQTESLINDEVLDDVLKILENYLNKDGYLSKIGTRSSTTVCFIAAQFKNTQMKTSSLSPAIIEAALTIIINQMNDEHTANDERYAALKQSPFIMSYTDDDEHNAKGVRVFQVKGKNQPEEQ